MISNVAKMLENTGQYADAEALYRRALAIREKFYGPDHLEVASSLNDVGVVLRQQKE